MDEVNKEEIKGVILCGGDRVFTGEKQKFVRNGNTIELWDSSLGLPRRIKRYTSRHLTWVLKNKN